MLKRHAVIVFYLAVTGLTLLGAWLAYFVFRGSLWVVWVANFGPLLAALLDGKEGVRQLLGGLLRWKVHWKWYLVIFVLPVWAFAVGRGFRTAFARRAGGAISPGK